MAQHGYLREYDEAPDRSDDRDRNWEERDRQGSWRGGDRDWAERGRERGMMLDRDRERSTNRDEDDGFFSRMGDRARSWFRDDDRQYRGTHEDNWSNQTGRSKSYGREHRFGGREGNYGSSARSPRNFSSHQDDHYLSWRERQMAALDKDYADYCREREQQFHSDFDTWRQTRRQSAGQGSQASTASGEAAELELTHERALAGEGNTPSPVGEATLGTNNSENTGRGRR